jgi:glycosyltransferase involved in cell wall biosynthesis
MNGGKMQITIGMASYNNPEQVWWTVQALRIYQDVKDCEILVVDNQGNSTTRKACENSGVRYEVYKEKVGTGPARNAVFDLAQGEFVLCMDSHVFLIPGAIARLKEWLADNWEDARNLLQGPLYRGALDRAWTHYNNEWRKHMWGTWGPPGGMPINMIPPEPFEIEMMGMGLFGCRKDSWLRFHKECRGFDGVEGVIHAKYRYHGRKVLCVPFLGWVHRFSDVKYGYPLSLKDKIRNFLYGFREIEMDFQPLYDHFGKDKVKPIEEKIFPR